MILSVLRRLGESAARTLVLAFAFLALAGATFAAPNFPKLTGRVVDDAQILSPAVETELTDKLERLEAGTRRQLVVVTLPTLQGYDIADYGYQLGRHWGVGQRGQPNAAPGTEKDNGVLFIVAPNERKVRIEVGYGLEPVLTDALSSLILQTKVLPRFKAGDMSGGVVAGTDALVQQLSLPEDQARAAAEQAPRQVQAQADGGDGLAGLIPLLIILFVVFALFRRRGRGAGWLAPIIISGLSHGGRDWGGGDWGGSRRSGGGGFRGGGGSFGGGGASGGW